MIAATRQALDAARLMAAITADAGVRHRLSASHRNGGTLQPAETGATSAAHNGGRHDHGFLRYRPTRPPGYSCRRRQNPRPADPTPNPKCILASSLRIPNSNSVVPYRNHHGPDRPYRKSAHPVTLSRHSSPCERRRMPARGSAVPERPEERSRFSALACAFPPRPETSSPPYTMLLCPVSAGDRANPEAGFSRPLLIATGHRVSPLVVVSKTPLPALCPRLRPCEGEGHRTGGEVQNVQQTTTRGEPHEQHGSSRSVSNIRKGSGIRREAGFKRRITSTPDRPSCHPERAGQGLPRASAGLPPQIDAQLEI